MGNPLRVLILEDTLSDAELLVAELERAGFAPRWSRVDALEAFAEGLREEPDVILADFHLSGFTALDALALLRELHSDVPLIVVTGAVGEETAAECVRQGAADYLLKDRLVRLAPAVTRSIEERRTRRAGEEAEARLRAAEHRYRQLFEQMKDCVAVYGAVDGGRDFAILDLNPSVERLEGVRRGDVLGRRVTEVFTGVAQMGLLDVFMRVLQSGRPEQHPTSFYEDGTRRGWRDNFVYRLPTGEVVAIYQDVTDRREAEMRLQSERDLLVTLANTLPDAVYYKDRESRFLLANEAAARLMGAPSATALLGTTDSDYYPEEMAEQFRRDEHEVLRTGRPLVNREDLVQSASGMTRWMLSTKVPVLDRGGAVTGIVGVSRDITDRREREQELRELNAAIAHTPDAVIVTDREGTIRYVNAAFEFITGFSRQEALGQNPRIIRSGRHDASFYRQLWDTISSGNVWRGRIMNRRKDGSLYQEEKTIAPIPAETGRSAGYVGIGRDVTEQVDFEDRLRQMQKMEAVGQLAGGVAHDFNNVLQVISGYVEVLQSTPATRSDPGLYFRQMKLAVEHGARLTSQLLAFSRRQALDLRLLAPNDAVAKGLDMIRRVIGEDIDLRFIPATALPSVKADSGQLEQVLLNLCINARDAMPRGGTLTIETAEMEVDSAFCASRPWARAGRYVRISVTDTGVGMDRATLGRIFEPFFTTKEGGRGTGLGLPVAYGIVKQHEGMIDVYSEPGRGTTVKLYLPAHEGPAGGHSPALGEAEPPGRGTETILFLDDDKTIRDLVRAVLEDSGYRVLLAADGQEAVEVLRGHVSEVSLAVLDVVVPRLGGEELYRAIKALNSDLPVLFCSGYSSLTGQTQFAREQGISMLQKPYGMGDLLRRVREIIGRPPLS